VSLLETRMASSRSRLHQRLERLGRKRGNRAVDALVDAARAVVRGRDGAPSSLRNFERNGEARVLRQLRGDLHVVFDVGANVGDWTRHALDAGAGHVHAFEISPATSASLAERYRSEERITVNAFGLSDQAGTITIRHFPDHPKLTTVTDYPHDAPSTAVDVPVRTGDDYLAEVGVDRIDFLKLDVEGAEEQVIKGFASAFDRGAVGVVQFEYGQVAILTKYLLRDFYNDMTSRGFEVGRIEADSVAFGPYDMAMETFADSNWIAVHASRRGLIDRLR
jgi:FkbM family methyltransferase